MPDVLIRGIDHEAGLRIVAAITTDLTREAVRRHQATGAAACALGRGLTSALLVGTLTKSGERVTLQVRGDGPLGGITADAEVDPSKTGTVRGYVSHPEIAGSSVNGRYRVVDVLGRDGVVNVVRDIGLKDRYQGQVALLSGEVDEDVEGYLRSSEQVPSALGCDVLLDDGDVVGAAGVLVQALPGADAESVLPSRHVLRTSAIFDYLRSAQRAPVGDAIAAAQALARAIYPGGIEFLGGQPLAFKCRCTRERVEATLSMLGTVELDEMIAEGSPAEVVCNFCNSRFSVERPALERIRADVAHGPRENN